MKLSKKVVFYILILVSITFLAACSETDGGESSETKEVKSSAVRILKLNPRTFTDYINVVGVVKPIDKANLGYQEGGIIETFFKKKGDYVKKDEIIVEIDNETLKASLDAAKAQYDLAEMTFEKQEKVYKENINSEFQYLQSKYNRDQAKANYELMKARYEKTFIKAPFNGYIDDKYYEEGEFALPGTPIIYLVNNYTLKVEAGIPERYVGQIKNGDKVKLRFKDILKDDISGRVSFVGSSIITENRTFPIEVSFTNDKKILKPELVAELFIERSTYTDVFIIPEEVVTRADNGFVVYTASNGKALVNNIEIISRFKDSIAVRNGLAVGDSLITVGYQNLVEQERINIVN